MSRIVSWSFFCGFRSLCGFVPLFGSRSGLSTSPSRFSRLTIYSGLDFDKDLKSYCGEFGVVGVFISTWPPVPRRSTRLPLLRLKIWDRNTHAISDTTGFGYTGNTGDYNWTVDLINSACHSNREGKMRKTRFIGGTPIFRTSWLVIEHRQDDVSSSCMLQVWHNRPLCWWVGWMGFKRKD